jgi:hypothetical protein
MRMRVCINLRHAEKQNVFSPGIFGCEHSDQEARTRFGADDVPLE